MSAFFRLVCDFQVLTPLFLGGASQEAELRAPSIKGVMRFWYRAVDPSFAENEPLLFGSGGENASQSLLRLRCRIGENGQERMRWADAKAEQLTQGNGRHAKNGLIYLGFPFPMRGNETRTAIRPGFTFKVEVTCHRAAPRGLNALRAALASMWTLGHFGSLGMRARRGFGALALTGWHVEDQDGRPLPDGDLAELPILHGTASNREWMANARRGLDVVRSWFGIFETEHRGVGHTPPAPRGATGSRGDPRAQGAQPRRMHHPHFGPRADFTVSADKIRKEDWRGALLALGRSLQDFRQRKAPDYGTVKDHVLFESHQGGRRIQKAPERATFGLPLTFRYGSLPQGRPVTFAPVQAERHGSLLFLRPALVGNTLSSLFLRLDGDVPGIDTPVELRGTGRSLDAAPSNAMDQFLLEMKAKG